MPAIRPSNISRRRRSSLALSAFHSVKPGIYGANRPVTFAPNVTPVSYVAPEGSSSSSTPEPGSPAATLFPPSDTPAPPPARRRVPPGKRRSLGYIPRPPNAFMLFRADFVRQKHVPGSIETNHGSLSKIIGNCWRALPLEEKKVWEVKAKHAKAEHKMRYPEYRFKPIHGKHKDKKKEKPATTLEDERRCEEVAQLLLEGKKGDELAAAVRSLDLLRSNTPATSASSVAAPAPLYPHRRSSSVPLPNDYYPHYNTNITIPTVSFFGSRPSSPISSISRQQQRMLLGQRRPSSVCPAVISRAWTLPGPHHTLALQRDDSPLPDVDTSIFEQAFLDTSFAFPAPAPDAPFQHQHQHPFDDYASLPPPALGPLDGVPPHQQPGAGVIYSSGSSASAHSLPELDPRAWGAPDPASHPSTAYSGSPAPSEAPVLHAPQPQPAVAQGGASFPEMWKEFTGSSFSVAAGCYDAPDAGMAFGVGPGVGLGLDFGVGGEYQQQVGYPHQHHHHGEGYEGLFHPTQGFEEYRDVVVMQN